MKKLLLCVGAAKTGTTWLYRNLGQNPDLWFSPEKEINYFFSRHGWFDRLSQAHRTARRERFEKNGRREPASFYENRLAWFRRYETGEITPDWYRGLFAEAPEDAWVCDFSPSTSLISPQGWREVADFAPEVKIIYVMREPLARLWSHAKFHAMFTGRLDEFRDMSLDQMWRFANKANLTTDGDYGTHLEGIYRKIPRENVFVLNYARIASDPHNVLREVEAFIGVGQSPQPKIGVGERVNTSEKLPMPEGFDAPYRDRFRRESALLVRLGVDFAKTWRDAYSGPFDPVKDLGWRVAKAFRR